MKKIVSFDFDDTLCMEKGNVPNKKIIEKLMKYHENGYECIIVTARIRSHEKKSWIKKNNSNRKRVDDFIKENNLPIKKVYYTSHMPKGPVLKALNVCKHYDDNKEQLESAEKYGIKAINCGKELKTK